MKKCACAVLCAALLLMTGCASSASAQIQKLGAIAYSVKMLNGLFYSCGEELYLLSGTETIEGSSSRVFVYNVDRDEMVTSELLENSVSMTAFCEAGDTVYFATISSRTAQGCDLYAWDKAGHEVRACAHFEEKKGIYALAWDGADRLFAATSYPAALYVYHISSGELQELCTSFTEEPFVYSMSYADGICYLGIGTKAALFAVDSVTGDWRSILPQAWSNDSFVYAQSLCGDKLFLLMSPSYSILEYDTRLEVFTDTGFLYRDKCDLPTGRSAEGPAPGIALNLVGDILFIEEGSITGHLSQETRLSYMDSDTGVLYGLTGAGICTASNMAGDILFQRDLGSMLEKDYIIPTEFLAYDGTLYVPWRRFIVRDADSGAEKAFLVTDEPQASTVTEQGIYTANYTSCTLYFYPFSTFDQDPAQTWMNNPEEFLLADIENQCRPTQMEVMPDGKFLVIGSGPLYGHFGGAVSVYDLEAGELLYTHENVVENHTIQSVKGSIANPGAVWLGTSPYGENTSPAYLDEPSHLILWDIETQTVLLDIVPDEAMRNISFIAEMQGSVFCVMQGARLLSFDAVSGQPLAANREDGITEVLAASGGQLLGISRTAVFSIDPETLQTTTLADGFTFLSHLTEDPVTGILYAFDDKELIRIQLSA